MIITKTPLRISLCGGGTDYQGWFRENGGIVVGGTINQYSYITARWLPQFHNYASRIVYSKIETVAKNSDIEHRAIRACLKMVDIDNGIELIHSCDIPGRSGTGSSSTFVVGVLKALNTLLGVHISPDSLARAAIQIEQQDLGETGGWQDQVWAAHGGLNIIRFRGDDYSVSPLTLSCSGVEQLESHLLLFFTGICRTSSDVAASYAPSLGGRREEQTAMMKIAENTIDAIYSCDWERLGHWIDASWRIKSKLSDKVSTNDISHMYATARLNGAWGGKITGSGGGGCMLLVAAPEHHRKIQEAMFCLGCTHIPFSFSRAGSEVVFYGR